MRLSQEKGRRSRLAALAAGSSRSVQRRCSPDQSLERSLIDLVTFAEIDRSPRVAFEARVEKLPGIPQLGALEEGDLHDALVAFAGADRPVVRPHGNSPPFPLLHHSRDRLLDQTSQAS